MEPLKNAPKPSDGLISVAEINHSILRIFICSTAILPTIQALYSFTFRKKIILTPDLLSNLFSITNEDEEYFLSSHQPISATRLDKFTVYRFIFGPNVTRWWRRTAYSLVSSDLSLAHLFLGHKILLRGHQDEFFLVSSSTASKRTTVLTILFQWCGTLPPLPSVV